MHPELFKIPGTDWPINSYGFMIMIGFLLATYVAVRRGKGAGVRSDIILDVGILGMMAGIVGAKINYVLQYPEHFQPPRTPGDGLAVFDFGDGLQPIGALLLGPLPFAIWYWRTQREKQLKLYSWQNGVLLVSTLFCALIGTRAFYVLQNRRAYDWSVITTWQSGFVLYGGLILAILVCMLYLRMRGESISAMADLSAPLVMLALAFGRIGCFLNGCCYGAVWPGGFCAVRFPSNSTPFLEQRQAGKIGFDAAESLPVIPTQLLETVVTIGLFFGLTWYDRKLRRRPGETFLVMGIAYGVWRFIIEFLRDDPRPTWLATLSYSQTLSLFIVVACAVWVFLARRRGGEPAPVPAVPPAEKAEKPR